MKLSPLSCTPELMGIIQVLMLLVEYVLYLSLFIQRWFLKGRGNISQGGPDGACLKTPSCVVGRMLSRVIRFQLLLLMLAVSSSSLIICVTRFTWAKRCAWHPWPTGCPWLTGRERSKRRERTVRSTWHWNSWASW